MRFVKGEITLEQYKEMLSVLHASPDSTKGEDTSTATSAIPTPIATPAVQPSPGPDPIPAISSDAPAEKNQEPFSGMYLYTAVASGFLAIAGVAAGDRIFSLGLGLVCIFTAYVAWQERGKR